MAKYKAGQQLEIFLYGLKRDTYIHIAQYCLKVIDTSERSNEKIKSGTCMMLKSYYIGNKILSYHPHH